MSSARRYFGTDGIRGRVGEGAISADFVLRLGNALGRVLAAGQPVRRDKAAHRRKFRIRATESGI